MSQNNLPLKREEVWSLIKEHNSDERDLIHYLESEAVLRGIARQLEEDEDYYGILGLVHDIDWGLTKDNPVTHLTKAPDILKEAGFDDEFINTVVSHGFGFDCAGLNDKERTEKIQHALASGETITGLIHSYALMRSGEITGMEPKGLKKKFKDKKFAAAIRRDVVEEIEKIGIPLDEFFDIAIKAIEEIKDQVGLK